jgi:hypothetical protein
MGIRTEYGRLRLRLTFRVEVNPNSASRVGKKLSDLDMLKNAKKEEILCGRKHSCSV